MKLVIQREQLLEPLQLVSGAIERRQTFPILSNVLISAHNRTIAMTATDLEIELTGYIELEEEINDSGEVTVSARKLLDICRTLPEGAILKLSTEKNRLNIRSGESHFVLLTLPASEFPNVEEGPEKTEWTLPQNVFKNLLEKTYFAMAQQDVRYYLNGMLLDVQPNMMRVVATDGHRLAMGVSDAVTAVESKESLQVIMPRKGVIELMRLLEKTDEIATLKVGTSHICVKSAKFTFISKLVEGKFPNYDKVVPKNCDKEIICDRQLLKQALTRVSILSNEKFRGVRLSFSSHRLDLSANNPEQEEAQEQMMVDYEGADLEVGFNVNYLLDICNIMSGDQLRMMLSDPNSALLIEPVAEEGFSYVIMPMRL
ncbi:MAG: DNA polymerase III subunit beta [Gammaproteobacteria bacterium GWF2_41_13]|nr:MAG: DNA polymerase III subunit beta [Gammaproteobacteria bacterium GWF2_41_13]